MNKYTVAVFQIWKYWTTKSFRLYLYYTVIKSLSRQVVKMIMLVQPRDQRRVPVIVNVDTKLALIHHCTSFYLVSTLRVH